MLVAIVILSLALLAACVRVKPKPPATTPPTTTPPTTTAPPPLSVKLTAIVNVPGSEITMAVRSTAGDTTTLYIGTQGGQIYAVDPIAQTFVGVLDISSLVQSGGERGLLGMTFSLDGTKFYVHYSALGTGATTVDEFAVSASVPGVFGAVASRRQVLTNPHSAGNHNGGSLLTGPDGMLYLSLGDNASGANAQSLTTLHGKILRINPDDPDTSGPLTYTVPNDNPFVTTPAGSNGEIWSMGLRNPFRMSFDRATGDLWLGDVGQSTREEVDFVAASDATHPSGKSANFGWDRREGLVPGPNAGSPPNPAGGTLVDPIFDIDHSAGDCAIIGGYVYRGSAIPALVGEYLYTDNCNGRIRALKRTGATVTNRDLGVIAIGPASFGEDNNGELYVLSLSGGIFRIEP